MPWGLNSYLRWRRTVLKAFVQSAMEAQVIVLRYTAMNSIMKIHQRGFLDLILGGGQGVAFSNKLYGNVWAHAANLVDYRSFSNFEVERQIPSPNYINAAGYSWYCHKDDGNGKIVEGLADGQLVYGQCHQQPDNIYVWDNYKNDLSYNTVIVTTSTRHCANNKNVTCTTDGQCSGSTCEIDYNSLDIVEGINYFKYAKPGYTPYTYPHPLTVSADTIPPSPPSGVMIL